MEGKYFACCTKITMIFGFVPKSLDAKNGDVDVQIQNSRILIQKQRTQKRDDGHNDTRQQRPFGLRGDNCAWSWGFWGNKLTTLQ